MLRTIIIALVAALSLSGCASSNLTGEMLTAEPPWGLGSGALPDSAADAEAVLAGLPSTLGAMNRTRLDELSAGYAGGGETVAIHIGTMDEARQFVGDPLMTLAEFLEILMSSGDLETVEASQLDADQPLVWASVSIRDGTQIIYAATWGRPVGEWVFNVEASSSEARTSLVHAFVETSNMLD